MTPKLLGPLETAAVLRSAKEQLHNDIATLLEAFTADTGLRVSGVGVYAHPQYLDSTAPPTTLLPPAPTDLDPIRPYRYTVSSVVDV